MAITGLPAGAQSAPAPYFGTWQFDATRSDVGSLQFTIRKSGETFTLTDDMLKTSYAFTVDGRSYATPEGFSAAWTQPGAAAWKVEYSLDGRRVAEENYTLSGDGGALTLRLVLGSASSVETRFRRIDEKGTDLAGVWLGTIPVASMELVLAPDSDGGIVYRITDQFEVRARMDGRPYPMTGPLIPRPSTASITATGTRSFRMVENEGTTLLLDADTTVSEDGKTLTVSGMTGGGVKRTWLFSRVR